MESQSGLNLWSLFIQKGYASVNASKVEIRLTGCPDEIINVLSNAIRSCSAVDENTRKQRFQRLREGADNYWVVGVKLAGKVGRIYNQNFQLLMLTLLSCIRDECQLFTSHSSERSRTHTLEHTYIYYK